MAGRATHWEHWTAVAALALQLGGVIHFAAVPHVSCPRHGDWMHASDVAESLGEREPSGAACEVRAGAPLGGAGHEHCVALLSRPGIAEGFSRADAVMARGVGLAQPPRRLGHGQTSVLSRAPKQSPPA
jgi:hypothetical protein